MTQAFAQEGAHWQSFSNEIKTFLNPQNRQFTKMSQVNFLLREHEEDYFIGIFPPPVTMDKLIGYRPLPNSTIRSIIRTRTKIISDNQYHNDEFGRRKSLHPKTPKTIPVVLAGCSATYGTELNDEDTLNNLGNEEPSAFYFYNNGIIGGSLNMTLADLKTPLFKSQQASPFSHFVYLFTPIHVARVKADWPNRWMAMTPYFKKNAAGDWQVAGTIQEHVTLAKKWFYELLDRLPAFLSHTLAASLVTQESYRYFCDLVVETRDEWRRHHPDGLFQFYFHPLYGLPPREVLDCLKEHRIHFFGGSQSPLFKEKNRYLNLEHPTKQANQAIIREIIQELQVLANPAPSEAAR